MHADRRPIRFALAALLFVGVASATSATRAQGDEVAQPFIVKVYAEWCGTCTMLEPTWKRIETEYQGKAHLVVFDVTDKERVEESKALAEVLGLTPVFNRYKSKTGTIAVLNANKNTVAVMKGEMDFAAYKEAIAKASAS
jgi:thiol-disulfide isomerase/thioredoxin